MPKFVYDLTEGGKDDKDLLGGKGANLAEMTRLGLPVPPGFTITTEACRHFLATGGEPEGLRAEVDGSLRVLEARIGRTLGDPDDPLLVAVRSGARFSMPGMMDTVLNVGLNDAAVHGLAARSGDPRFAWDSYRRLIQMFGRTVLGIDGNRFESLLDDARRARGAAGDHDLTVDDLRTLVASFQAVVTEETGRGFPQDAREQLGLAVRAVFRSWNGERARLYRRRERIPDDLGTAVTVVAMVFGNRGPGSGTGVAFTRDPATGRRGVYGDYLPNAQGEDVVAGIRNTVPLAHLETLDPASHRRLLEIMATLEHHYRDLCDIEFTIESGRLWMLQTRVGKRTAAAAFRIACDLVDQGLIDEDEALRRVTGEQLARLMFPRFAEPRDTPPGDIPPGRSASGGSASGVSPAGGSASGGSESGDSPPGGAPSGSSASAGSPPGGAPTDGPASAGPTPKGTASAGSASRDVASGGSAPEGPAAPGPAAPGPAPEAPVSGRRGPIARGIAASPGAAVGKAVFDRLTAVERARAGERVILVRRETNPDDLDGMIAAEGILTSRGGKTSHAAVVARGMGKTCVCGAEELDVDPVRRRFTTAGGVVVEEGDVLSVDGTLGLVHLGEVPVVPSPVAAYFDRGAAPDVPTSGSVVASGDPGAAGRDGHTGGEAVSTGRGAVRAGGDTPATGGTAPPADDPEGLVACVDRLMRHADARRRMRVRANADTPADAARARRHGAEGIGLCRTEHMFLGDRGKYVERLILADTDAGRTEALEALLPLQRDDFIALFEAMDGLPVTVRLLDPPLHEFLPDLTELSVRAAVAAERGEPAEDDVRLLRAVRRLHEHNPMLGLRGVRLGLTIPGLFRMQVRAIGEAVAARVRAGGSPHVEILIPLVASVRELEIVREEARRVLAAVREETGTPLGPSGGEPLIGTMIELPRAALTAAGIADAADFFSFGTNDLTQTTWGFSRDDVEASFFTSYLEKGVFAHSPFESIDPEGTGRLVRLAAAEGRKARPELGLGVCGEHGGDPESVRFFHDAGLDYVSCSPFRVPVARLEAGRAVVLGDG